MEQYAPTELMSDGVRFLGTECPSGALPGYELYRKTMRSKVVAHGFNCGSRHGWLRATVLTVYPVVLA